MFAIRTAGNSNLTDLECRRQAIFSAAYGKDAPTWPKEFAAMFSGLFKRSSRPGSSWRLSESSDEFLADKDELLKKEV